MQLLRDFVLFRAWRRHAAARRDDGRAYTVTVPAPLAPPAGTVIELRRPAGGSAAVCDEPAPPRAMAARR